MTLETSEIQKCQMILKCIGSRKIMLLFASSGEEEIALVSKSLFFFLRSFNGNQIRHVW